ncbi:unnamed protein product [Durusdinium trenchii]|uniref:Ion transport domain-containing protein n=2 Tax=Durusdinium trenchii TaxID=1381693 RepID=A0ABP0N0T7_9DINO
MELEELLEILTEQQRELLQLADQQREVWAQNLDVAFQQILRRHAGSRRTTSLEEKLLRGSRNGPAQPSESQPSESSISTELFRAAEILTVKPTLQPRAPEEDEPPGQWHLEDVPMFPDTVNRGKESLAVRSDISPIDEGTKATSSIGTEEIHDSSLGLGKRDRGMSDQSGNMSVVMRASTSPNANNAFVNIVAQGTEFEGTRRCAGCLKVVSAYMDQVASVLVFLNAVVMLLDFEMSGRATGSLLGMNDGPYWTSQGLFRALGITFDVLFTVELALRIAIEGYGFVKDAANLFDSVLVTAGLAEHFLLLIIPEEPVGSQLMRALSSIRAVRMLRAFRFSQGLKLLLNACQSFITSLCWSMVLLGVVMVVASLIIGNLLQDYLRNEEVSLEDREKIWRFYGTAYRSWYTLYEITFAGNWPTMARPVLDKVNHGFVVFFVLYITIIVFALIRVITAVFLKDTLDAANNDAELRMAEGLRKKAEYVEKLEGIFQAIDDTGDGMITEERLTFILDNPKVKAYFQTLDVDVHEGAALFHILDDGDGECTLEEFIGGILRCKGPARAIDQVAMMADLRQLDKKLSKLIQGLHDAQIVVINESGEMPRPISKSASNSQHSSTSMEVTKTQSRRRASEAAQSFLYKTSMLPKLKHAGTASLGAEETFVM